MKKILVMFIVIWAATMSSEAQTHKGENFLFFNRNYDFNPGGYYNLFNNNSNQSTYLLTTKAINKEMAWRFGLGYRDNTITPSSSTVQRNDTIYQTMIYKQTALIHAMAGKEWRKYLHEDVSIVGGVDLALGGGPSQETMEEHTFYQNNHTWRFGYTENRGFGLYAAATLFTGIRICWKRLVLGYSILAPVQSTFLFSKNTNISDFDMSLSQSLSFGYRFNSKKPIKQ